MTKARIDPPDTLEAAAHFLMKLGSEGMALSKVEYKQEFRRLHGKGPRVLVGGRLVIELEPFH